MGRRDERHILWCTHFKLKLSEQGKTVLMHNEDFSGIAIGFADLPPDVIAEGYHQMNMALKSRVETKN